MPPTEGEFRLYRQSRILRHLLAGPSRETVDVYTDIKNMGSLGGVDRIPLSQNMDTLKYPSKHLNNRCVATAVTRGRIIECEIRKSRLATPIRRRIGCNGNSTDYKGEHCILYQRTAERCVPEFEHPV